ncbi:MAG: SoxR reducing system RseC family protein [Alistipes sp.]
MNHRIEKCGVVDHVEKGFVSVKIIAGSACNSCKAREACGMGESEAKILKIASSEALHFASGDAVTLSVSQNMGAMAVLIAYVGAVVVLIGAILVALKVFSLGEGVAALVGVVAVALYYVVLWFFRKMIENKIHFIITKQ